MKRMTIGALLCCVVAGGIFLPYATESALEKGITSWEVNHFYFYNESGTAERLPLARKIAVRFGVASLIEQRELLEKLGASSIIQDRFDPALFILIFQSGTTEAQIVAALRDVSASGIAEAYPVVIKDNIEAIAEGIAVKPKTYLSSGDLRTRLARYGTFAVREMKELHGVHYLFFEWIGPPLNLYLFANLTHKDAWVFSAAPIFRYLEAEATAVLRVEPVTGTLAEIRTITLDIYILNPRLILREDLLVKFNEADFVPKTNNTPRLEKLLTVVGEEKKSVARRGRATVISFSWQFKHYEVGKQNPQQLQGDWTVTSPKIVLTEGEEGGAIEITSAPASFSVVSLIGAGAVSDIPPPRPLFIPVERVAVSVQQEPFIRSQYIFDRWLANPSAAAQRGQKIAIVFFVASGVFLFVPVFQYGSRKSRRAARVNEFVKNLSREAARARTIDNLSDAYKAFNEITAMLLSRVFGLSPHPTYTNVAERHGEMTLEMSDDIRTLFTLLEEQQQQDFSPDRRHVEQIYEVFQRVLSGLSPRLRHFTERNSV